MAKYGVVIDLNKCLRCRTCMVACKIQNNIPPKARNRVEHYRMRPVEWEEGDYPDVRRIFIPILCMHCEEPACLEACPVGAISKRADGIVVVDKKKCDACGSCMEACPYGAPFLLEKADKCDFCAEARLDAGHKEPYCIKSCVGEAMMFGDLDNPASEVSKLVTSGQAEPLCPEFGTGPHVYYIQPVWYRKQWKELSKNHSFLQALGARNSDLAAIQTPEVDTLKDDTFRTSAIGFPLGALAIGAAGLDYLAKRKVKVALEEREQRR